MSFRKVLILLNLHVIWIRWKSASIIKDPIFGLVCRISKINVIILRLLSPSNLKDPSIFECDKGRAFYWLLTLKTRASLPSFLPLHVITQSHARDAKDAMTWILEDNMTSQALARLFQSADESQVSTNLMTWWTTNNNTVTWRAREISRHELVTRVITHLSKGRQPFQFRTAISKHGRIFVVFLSHHWLLKREQTTTTFQRNKLLYHVNIARISKANP